MILYYFDFNFIIFILSLISCFVTYLHILVFEENRIIIQWLNNFSDHQLQLTGLNNIYIILIFLLIISTFICLIKRYYKN